MFKSIQLIIFLLTRLTVWRQHSSVSAADGYDVETEIKEETENLLTGLRSEGGDHVGRISPEYNEEVPWIDSVQTTITGADALVMARAKIRPESALSDSQPNGDYNKNFKGRFSNALYNETYLQVPLAGERCV